MIVPTSEYHVTVMFNPQMNRQVAHFRTTTGEPHIDTAFPLPDTYEGKHKLDGNDERLLALVFNQIVQSALASVRQQAEAEALTRAAQPLGRTQQAFVDLATGR